MPVKNKNKYLNSNNFVVFKSPIKFDVVKVIFDYLMVSETCNLPQICGLPPIKINFYTRVK